MKLKSILLAGAASFALLALAIPAANADENDETRDLNLRQLDDPGAGVRAVPGHEDDADDDDDDDGAAAADDDDDDDDMAGPAVGDEFGADNDDDDDDGDDGDD